MQEDSMLDIQHSDEDSYTETVVAASFSDDASEDVLDESASAAEEEVADAQGEALGRDDERVSAETDADAGASARAESTLALQDGELPSDKVADLVEYIVCGLVCDKDAVALDVTDSNGAALIEISCAQDDTGRIIGRKGRTIKAIRTLARALGSRVNTAVEVEVLG